MLKGFKGYILYALQLIVRHSHHNNHSCKLSMLSWQTCVLLKLIEKHLIPKTFSTMLCYGRAQGPTLTIFKQKYKSYLKFRAQRRGMRKLSFQLILMFLFLTPNPFKTSKESKWDLGGFMEQVKEGVSGDVMYSTASIVQNMESIYVICCRL